MTKTISRWLSAIKPGQLGTISKGFRVVEILNCDANPGLYLVRFGTGKPEIHKGVRSFSGDAITYLNGGRI